MPNLNAGNVDERIVQMQIDHQKFEAGAKKTIDILEKLDNSLQSLGSKNSDSLDSVASTLDRVNNKFSIFGTIGDQVLRNLTNKAIGLIDQMGRLANSLTIDQVSAGWSKYDEMMQSTQTIMAATAKDWDDQAAQMAFVNEQLDRLNWFTDETSYNLTDMTSNIGKFTSNGVKLETAVTAMEGIATWAGVSGANAGEASRAMYNLSQALATGSVKLIDWKSIENANMATREFKETALETAADLGMLVKTGDDAWRTLSGKDFTTEQFNTQLSEGWFSSDVLLATLNQYGDFAGALNDVSSLSDLTATQLLQLIDIFKKSEEEVTEQDLKEFDRIISQSAISVEELMPLIEDLAGAQYDLGRKAFKAAQEAKTFKEAIDATKDAASTTWMNIFKSIFGDYLSSKDLWTDVANSFYNIFVEPLNNLYDLIDQAFGSKPPEGPVNATSELSQKLAEAGYSLSDFTKAYDEINSDGVEKLVEEYGSLNGAFQAGAIDAETFRKVLEKISEVEEPPVHPETWLEIDDGQGHKTVEEVGAVYELVEHTDEELAAYNSLLEESDSLLNTWLYDSEAAAEAADSVSGGQHLKNALLNILDIIEQISSAVTTLIFGTDDDIKATADGIYNGLARFDEITAAVADNLDKVLPSIMSVLSFIFGIVGAIGGVARYLVGLLASAIFSAIWNILTVLSEIYEIVKNSGVLHAFADAFMDIFAGILAPLRVVHDLVHDLFITLFGNSFIDFNWAERLSSYLIDIGARLQDAAAKFRSFMEGKDVADAVTNAFNATVSAISTVASYVSIAWTKFRNLFDVLRLAYNRKGITGVFDVIDAKISLALKKHPLLLQAFQTVSTLLRAIGTVAQTSFNAIENWFSAIDFSNIQQNMPTLESFQEFFQNLKKLDIFNSFGTKITTFLKTLEEFFSGKKFDETGIREFFDRIRSTFNLIYEWLFKDSEEIKQRAKNALLNILNGFKEALSEISLGDVLQGMRLAGFASLVIEIAGVVKTFKDLESEVKGVPESLSRMFKKLGGAFDSLSLSFKTNVLLKVLIGVGILAASLYALSTLDQDKLTHTAVVVGILFAVIASIAKHISSTKLIGSNVDIKLIKVIPTFAGILFSLASVIVSIGIAIALVTSAIHKAGSDNVWTAVGMLGVFLASITAIVIVLFAMAKRLTTYKRMDAIGTMLMKLGASMFFIAKAIGSFVIPIVALGIAIKYIGNENISQAAWDLFAFALTLGLIVTGITGLLLWSKNATPAKIDKIGNTLLKLGGSMILISMAISALAFPMIAIAAGIRFINSENGNEMGKAGAWLAIFALILGGIIAGLMAILSSKNMTPARIDKIGNTMLKIAGSMALISLGISMLATPLIAIAAAIKLLGSDNMGVAFNTILAFAAIMSVLAGIALLAGKFGNGPGMLMAAGAMALLAFGINLLVPALLSFIAIGTSLAALAVNIDNFWEAAARLGKLARIMLIFGFGIMMAGIGITAFGIGISLAAVSALVFAAAAWVLSKALGELSTAFPAFIDGIAKAGATIAENWKTILLGTAAFVALAVAIGWMIRQVGKLVNGEKFGRGFGTFLASLATGIGQMASSIGTKITEVFPKILPILGSLLVLAALHLVGLIPDLTHIMVMGFVTLFNSVATELETNSEAVVGSAVRIVKALLNTISGVFESTILSSDFWGDLDLLEKILFGLGSAAMLAGLTNNLLTPFKTFVNILSTGVNVSLSSTFAWLLLILGIVGLLALGISDMEKTASDAEHARNEELFGDSNASIEKRIKDFAKLQDQAKKMQEEIDKITYGDDLDALLSPEYEQMLKDSNDFEMQLVAAKSELARDLAEITGESYQDIFKQLKESDDFTQTEIYQKYLQMQAQSQSDFDDLTANAALDEKFAMRNGAEPVIEAPVAVKPEFASDMTGDAQSEIEALKSELLAQFSDVAGDVTGEGNGIGSMLMSAISGDITDNGGLMTSALTDSEQTAIDSASASAYAASLLNGYNVSAGTAQGIYNGGPLVQKAMRWMSSLTSLSFQTDMEIESPSRVMARLAEYIPAGIAVGIEHNTGEAVDSMTVLGSSILAAMQMAMLRVATVADERFEFSPMITPVVDMSNVEFAANSAGSMFGNATTSLQGSMRISTERAQNTAEAVRDNSSSSGIVSEIQNLSGKLDMLEEAISNMQIVLDTGVLVGSTSRRMDDAFGALQVRKERGN